MDQSIIERTRQQLRGINRKDGKAKREQHNSKNTVCPQNEDVNKSNDDKNGTNLYVFNFSRCESAQNEEEEINRSTHATCQIPVNVTQNKTAKNQSCISCISSSRSSFNRNSLSIYVHTGAAEEAAEETSSRSRKRFWHWAWKTFIVFRRHQPIQPRLQSRSLESRATSHNHWSEIFSFLFIRFFFVRFSFPFQCTQLDCVLNTSNPRDLRPTQSLWSIKRRYLLYGFGWLVSCYRTTPVTSPRFFGALLTIEAPFLRSAVYFHKLTWRSVLLGR